MRIRISGHGRSWRRNSSAVNSSWAWLPRRLQRRRRPRKESWKKSRKDGERGGDTRGRIGPREGTYGARIYRGLPERGCVLVKLLVEASEKDIGHGVKLVQRATVKPLGAEWLRDRRGEQNGLYNVQAPKRHSEDRYILELHSKIGLCISEAGASVYISILVYALACINKILLYSHALLCRSRMGGYPAGRVKVTQKTFYMPPSPS